MLNVDRWLDTVTPEQFDEWVAFDRLEPNKMDRQREILTRGLICLCNAWGAKLEFSDIDPDYEQPQAQESSHVQAFRRAKESYAGI